MSYNNNNFKQQNSHRIEHSLEKTVQVVRVISEIRRLGGLLRGGGGGPPPRLHHPRDAPHRDALHGIREAGEAFVHAPDLRLLLFYQLFDDFLGKK